MLYLMLRVADPRWCSITRACPTRPNGDRVLRTWQDNRRQEYVIATSAPGSVRAYPLGPLQPGRWRAYSRLLAGCRGWLQPRTGNALDYAGGRLGFYLVNVGHRPGGRFETLGNISPLDAPRTALADLALPHYSKPWAPFSNQGSHLQVVDRTTG